uniref:Uncharacterized protein n=1 Tax=Zea mays TaxID=4577 RepID=B4FPT1_MAIZE|nr:unknown [Zea mays]
MSACWGCILSDLQRLLKRHARIYFQMLCVNTCTIYLKCSQNSIPTARWLGRRRRRAGCCFARRLLLSCDSASTCSGSRQYTSCDWLHVRLIHSTCRNPNSSWLQFWSCNLVEAVNIIYCPV